MENRQNNLSFRGTIRGLPEQVGNSLAPVRVGSVAGVFSVNQWH